MATNQSALHAAIRTSTGTAGTYNSDWLSLMAAAGFTTGPFNARMIGYLNARLVADGDANAPYSSITAAQRAYAVRRGVNRWTDVTSLL